MDESSGWEGERSIVHLLCVYAYTDSSSISVIEESYASLKEKVLGFKQKGRVSTT